MTANREFFKVGLSHDTRKLVFRVSDQVLHIPVCSVTGKGKKLESLSRKGLYYMCSENKGANQMYS